MNLGLRGNVAVVIGGANGIGRAIAEAFAAEGAQVAALDADGAVESTVNEIAARFEIDAVGVIVDATQFNQVQDAALAIARRWQRPCDHLVYAAGAGSGKFGFPFWNLAPHDWPRALNVNLLGAVNAAHAFVRQMTEARRGTMLFISSIAGQIGSQTDPPYSAAKAALINFAQCAAKDLAPFNVRVNTICPGMIKTAINRSVWQAWHDQQPPDGRLSYEQWTSEKIARTVPLGRWQEAEDVAALAVFLASERSKNTTGQTLNVDGGQVMNW
jgi:NAD(P)-dependent dehydrogenase (short-subunit alcohol dehydrogenase family)